MNSLVSVIIPAYNHEKYVQDAIKSVINQTYKNIELIVIDDGSKDNTWQKIKELEDECKKRFTNIYFETKENEGTCKTQNKLISKASGDFITLLASDDLMTPNLIETLINFLSKHEDYVLVGADDKLIDSNSNLIGWDKDQNIQEYNKAKFKTFGEFLQFYRTDINFNSDDFGNYKNLLKGNHIPNGFLIRKNIILNYVYPFTPEAPLEDYYMMLQLSKVGKFKFINEPLSLYRIHNSNTSKNKEKMERITKETLLYEEKIINKKENNKWKNIFYSEIYKIKIKFKLGFIKYCRKTNIINNVQYYTLDILSKEIFRIKKKS